MKKNSKLLKPLTFGRKGIEVKNRIVMAPMTTWASNEDFTVSQEEIAWYSNRVKGVGLVITGCTHVTPEGIGFTDEFAAYDDRFIPGLKDLADVAKSDGAPAILQIFHAGNKAYAEFSPYATVVSASSIMSEVTPFSPPKLQIPRALEENEIWEIVKAFGQTTRRAIVAGFDGVEIHGAHGFLIQNFLSPMFNERKDQWGGNIENRMRLAIEIVREIKRTIAEFSERPFLLGFRISPEELPETGLRLKDSLALIDALILEDVDYLHFSLFQALTQKPLYSATSRTTMQVLSSYINGRVPMIAAGELTTPEQAEAAIGLGLDLAAIGRGMVINPDWALQAYQKAPQLTMVLDLDQISEKKIPKKLIPIIHGAKGWIKTA
ncbi:NADH-dependent flavin oxidoreductase [Pedobacter sp.]|uniref:NADH-dependent flavin oxidoreductase n=1 Tax=Pedobacter sp. TaxID=1411316 RepID=UPI003BA979DD